MSNGATLRAMLRGRFWFLLAVGWVGLVAPGRAERTGLETGLRELGQSLFADAERTFGRVLRAEAEGGVPQEWLPVARALALINAPPRTAAKRAEAEALLRAAYTGDDERVAPVAGYYLARLRRGTAEEAALLQELRRRWPDHPLAQLGVVKAGMARTFAAPDATARRAVLAELEAEVAALTDRTARRELHAFIGHAALLTGGDERRAMTHLMAAVEAGVPESSMRYRGYLIRIAELARTTGEVAVAREYYERFQRLFPRDDRQQVVRERLEELADTAAAGKAGS